MLSEPSCPSFSSSFWRRTAPVALALTMLFAAGSAAADDPPAPAPAPVVAAPPAPVPPPTTTQPARAAQAEDRETPSAEAPAPSQPGNGIGLIVGGAILLPVGVAGTVGWLYFYVSAGLYGGGGSHGGGPILGTLLFFPALVGLAAVGGGIALLAVGSSRLRRGTAGRATAHGTRPRLYVTPSASDSAFGLSALGSF